MVFGLSDIGCSQDAALTRVKGCFQEASLFKGILEITRSGLLGNPLPMGFLRLPAHNSFTSATW